MTRFDVAIVGAGIAGATLAAAIGGRARVVLLEAEDVAGYHATGRSAAFWSETYGGPAIQPLTTASGIVLRAGGYLEPLGSLHIGRAADDAKAEAMLADFAGSGVPLERVDPATLVPGLRDDWTIGLLEPSCAYIDVARLHADALATARRAGATVVLNAAVRSADRTTHGWSIDTNAGRYEAAIIADAAGAWADNVARLSGVAPIGIQPYRRCLAQLRTDPVPPQAMPHVADLAGQFYFKPESGGKLWLSPHDEIASDPCDAAPDEIDIAIAIDRFEQAVDWRVLAVERRWAGLRSFAPDRLPVYGFDTKTLGFFWFAGQGGFGIQTAPAAAAIGAALLLGASPDPSVASIDSQRYSPARFGANLR